MRRCPMTTKAVGWPVPYLAGKQQMESGFAREKALNEAADGGTVLPAKPLQNHQPG